MHCPVYLNHFSSFSLACSVVNVCPVADCSSPISIFWRSMILSGRSFIENFSGRSINGLNCLGFSQHDKFLFSNRLITRLLITAQRVFQTPSSGLFPLPEYLFPSTQEQACLSGNDQRTAAHVSGCLYDSVAEPGCVLRYCN